MESATNIIRLVGDLVRERDELADKLRAAEAERDAAQKSAKATALDRDARIASIVHALTDPEPSSWDNDLPDEPCSELNYLQHIRWMRWRLRGTSPAEPAATAPTAEPHAATREVHESGWQWRPVGDGAFAPPFGTIRVCRGCGCLVAGGPTACMRCAT